MTTKLIDTATEADWTFLADPHDEYEAWRRAMVEDLYNEGEPLDWGVNPDTVAQIRRRTDRIAAKYEVPAEDLYEDTILHMAVRPERVTEASVNDLAWYANGVATNLAKPVVNRRVREESLEALLSAPVRDLG